jgi:hypothetical protein
MHQGNKITDSETQRQRIWTHKNQQEKIQNTMKICSLRPYKSKKKPVGQTCLAFLQLYWHVFPTMISVYTSKSLPSIYARLFSIKTKRLNSSVIMLHVPPIHSAANLKETKRALTGQVMPMHLLLQLNVLCKQLGRFTLACEQLHSPVIPQNLPLSKSPVCFF